MDGIQKSSPTRTARIANREPDDSEVPELEKQEMPTTNIIEKALREKPWVTKVSEFVYRVVPRRLMDSRNREHGKYELSFSWDEGLPVVGSCVDVRTTEACKGFANHRHCYHQAALVIHLLQLLERQERRAA